MDTRKPASPLAEAARRVTLERVRDRELGERVTPMRGTRSGAPVFMSNGVIDYVCADCGAVLCQRMRAGQLAGIVFLCACGSLNRVPEG